MEVDEGEINQMAYYLRQTLSEDAALKKQAEVFLKSEEDKQNYLVHLLSLLSKEDTDINIDIKVVGAIAFKNYVKRKWNAPDTIPQTDKDTVKKRIVDLMMNSDPRVQKELSEAIAIIGYEDFPKKWPNLVQEIVNKFKQGDVHIINGILQIVNSIFKKFSVPQSQILREELKLNEFSPLLTNLFVELKKVVVENDDVNKVIFGSLVLISKIFYHLNYQELLEYFKDEELNKWMDCFHSLLILENPLLVTDDDEPGVLEELRSQICVNIGLCARKYEEEFQPFVQKFVTAVWNLLLTPDLHNKYDLLVSNAIQFLVSVADRLHTKSPCPHENVLSSFCEKIILPNMEMSKDDEELFKNNPKEYIQKDLAGSLRLGAAYDLLKLMSKYFEDNITQIFGLHYKTFLGAGAFFALPLDKYEMWNIPVLYCVSLCIDKYNKKPTINWKSMDAAMYLVTSKMTNVKLTEFANYHVIPELLNATNINQFPILKADCIKFVTTFCSELPHELVKSTLPSLVKLLTSPHEVIHTYAVDCINEILLIKAPYGTALVKSNDLVPIAEDLLKSVIDHPEPTEKESMMKAVKSLSDILAKVPALPGCLLPSIISQLQQAYQKYLEEVDELSRK